ncbi:MmcQ/YjbR family DNA-binding protein [Paenibacillus filicis]|uniref:MmcQ/YjbR family DNA-binding protein n=1 Tax=Paenibacillus gyeongsangnamensis TaxID=3388067 RepID=A0ABT4Q7J6_9BACL|nr:MmcQ/YjbR family DNA-binding protein [Paenibacillus filicis]MCZ8512804.1 MmcQ/YjbR family DNA-binding protein [Paenibacillus filicis]
MEPHKAISSEQGLNILNQVRSMCAVYPEVEEAIDAFGHTSFRVKDKPFVMLAEWDGTVTMSIKTATTTQEFLIQKDPRLYSKTRYIGQHGWVSVELLENASWQELEELVLEAYSRTAPKRLIQTLRNSGRG